MAVKIVANKCHPANTYLLFLIKNVQNHGFEKRVKNGLPFFKDCGIIKKDISGRHKRKRVGASC
jgi:hypothetical protein